MTEQPSEKLTRTLREKFAPEASAARSRRERYALAVLSGILANMAVKDRPEVRPQLVDVAIDYADLLAAKLDGVTAGKPAPCAGRPAPPIV
jgi:hypothetical protein